MTLLQTLRQSRSLLRWMLLGFCLSLGVAVASPVLHPQSVSLVCTAAGSVKLVSTDGAASADAAPSAHLLDCVLCLPAGLAAPQALALQLPQDLRHVWRSAAVPAVRWHAAYIRPARDPPSA